MGGKKNLDNGRYPKTKDCQDDDPLYVQTLLFVGPGQWSFSSVSDGKTCGRWTLGPQICIMSMHHVHVCTVQYIGNNNNYGVSM